MDETETLGKFLKDQRESKKISLREVAKNTRVREHVLRAIEEDQYHLLPPATYVKGFLLAYAKYLKLDPNDVLLRYENVLKSGPIPHPSTQPPRPPQEVMPAQPPKPKRKVLWNTKQTWVVVAVIVATFIVLYFFSPFAPKRPTELDSGKHAERKSPSIPSPSGTASSQAPERKTAVPEKKPPAPSVPVTATTSVQEKKPIALQLKAIEETWLSLQADDQPGKDMILKPGEGMTVQASGRILIKLGNAGGLDLALNGKPLGKPGRSGEVLTLIVTPQGVEVKRSEKASLPKESPRKEENSNSEPEISN